MEFNVLVPEATMREPKINIQRMTNFGILP